MSDPVLLLRFHRFVDESGKMVEVVVAPEVAKLLDERRTSAKEKRRKKRETAFTDLKGKKRSADDQNAKSELGQEEIDRGHKRRIKGRRERDDFGNAWEGPRFEFDHLIGSGRIWDGPPKPKARCRSCGGTKLTPNAYCIECDRSGMDKKIPKPTSVDIEKRKGPKAYRPGKTKGGCKGK